MRVLLDCRMATWSGIGRYSTGLTRALAARGDLDLIQVIEPGTVAPAEGETIVAGAHAFAPSGGFELGSIVRRVKPDITHCMHVPTPLPARHPLVVMIHDLTPLRVAGTMPSRMRRTAYRWWNARAAKIADAIVTNSAFTASDFESEFPGVRSRPMVTPLGVDDFARGLSASAEAIERIASGPYLLSMGNTKPHKNLSALLFAFAVLAPEFPDLRLVLVGKDVPGYVLSALGDRDLAKRVSFTGPVDDDTLRGLYAGAAAFAFPSLYEGFGLPPLEAMAMGCPVVCSNATSLPEVVGDAALLVPPGEEGQLAAAIRRILDDADARERLVEAGHLRAAGFTWERTADLTVQAYRAVLL